jgi:hypothetical protein
MSLAVMAVASLAVLAPASSAAQPAVRSYDIARYELEIRPDFDTGALSIAATVLIDNPKRDRVFQFWLSARFTSITVLANGRPAHPRMDDGSIEIDAPPTDRARLEFRLHAKELPSTDEQRGAIDRDSLFLLWSDRFYPIDFGDWSTIRTAVLLPPGMLAMAPGRLQSTRATSEGVWHEFEASVPTVAASVFADRRWIRTARRVGGVDMETLLHPEVNRFADALFAASGDVLAYYTELHGFYPAEKFAFVTISGMYARRAFPGFVGYTPAYLEKTMAGDGYDGHETALLWWGYATRGQGRGAFQWTEGFGDYVEIMYAEARGKALPANLRRARDAYLALPPGSDVALADLRGNTPQPLIHGRLPWLMAAQRACLGDERFRAAIRRLFDEFRYRTFTLEEFREVMSGGNPAGCRLPF